MKKFAIPEVEVIHFVKKDVIATSGCFCVECQVCPPGSNDCPKYETCPTYYIDGGRD